MLFRARLCLALLLGLAAPAAAQEPAPPPVEMGGTELRTLTSALVEGQEYALHVHLPRSYWNPETRTTYPVLYVLDGQWDFPLVATIYGGQYYDGFVPELIIVGITWGGQNPRHDSLRVRDFVPTRSEARPQAGGANAFLSAITDEIIPFIEAEYPARPEGRVLMGSSFGGLFTLYAMFHATDVFDGYLVSSPALQWDDGLPFRYEAAYAERRSDFPARVFFTIGGYEDVAELERFVAAFEGRGHEGLAVETYAVEGTGHSGHKPAGFARGLQFIYERPSLSLPAALLDDYTGTYRLGDQLQVEVRRQDDHLIARQGEAEMRLHAEAEDRFYIPGSYLLIRFRRQGDAVLGLDVETFNEALFLERVAP